MDNFKSTAKIIERDILSKEDIDNAIKGQDIVYANLSGAVNQMAKIIIEAMHVNGVNRLIFVTTLGIYNEVAGKFGEWNNRMIDSKLVKYRKATDIIEKSALNYTIVLPSWLTDKDETDYETTQKGEKFTRREVARKAFGPYIVSVTEEPSNDVKASVDVQNQVSKVIKGRFSYIIKKTVPNDVCRECKLNCVSDHFKHFSNGV